jgi:hypothetical protein
MKVTLKNVRLSYPNLFNAKGFEDSAPKFSCTLIMDKETCAKQIAKLEAAIDSILKENFKGSRKAIKGVCIRDGAEKTDDNGDPKDGYGEGVMFANASNISRPQVVDKDPSIPLTEDDAKIYAGCLVNAVIDIWWQDNKYGKRVNASLKAVQFAGDGEAFGEARVNVEDEFSNVEDDEDGEDGLG